MLIKELIERKFGIQVTSRDVEILQFVNECGFCIMPQIQKRFCIQERRSYQIMKKLVGAGLVQHKRIFHLKHGIYFVTNVGSQFTQLPPIEKVSLGVYEHQITLTNVYLKLRQLYPDANLISERELLHAKYAGGVGKKGHISDGILAFSEDRQIAIEVELTLKGRHRIERIIRSYSLQLLINEVWYFCPQGLINPLRNLTAKMTFIKIHNLAEFLR